MLMLHHVVLLSALVLGVSNSLERGRKTVDANSNLNSNTVDRELNSGLLSDKQRLLASALLAERQRLRRENGQLRSKLLALRQSGKEMDAQLASHKSESLIKQHGLSKSLSEAAAQLRAALEDANDAYKDEDDEDDDASNDDVTAIIAPPTPAPDEESLRYKQATEAQQELKTEVQKRKQASKEDSQLERRIAAVQQKLRKDKATAQTVHQRQKVLSRTEREQESNIISTQKSLSIAQKTLNRTITGFVGPNETSANLREEVAQEMAEQRSLQKKKTALMLTIGSLRELLNTTSFQKKAAVARRKRATQHMKQVMIARIGDLEDDQEQLDRSLTQATKAAAKQHNFEHAAEQEVTKLQAGLTEDEKSKAKLDAQALLLSAKTKSLRKNLTQIAKSRRLAAMHHTNETAKLRNALVAKVRDLEDQEERLEDTLQIQKIRAKETAGNRTLVARRLEGRQKNQLELLNEQLEEHSEEAANATNKSKAADKTLAALNQRLKMFKDAAKNTSQKEDKLKQQYQETKQEVGKVQKETVLLGNTSRKDAKAAKARIEALQKQLKDISKSAKKEGSDSVKQIQAALKTLNKAKTKAQLQVVALDAEFKAAKNLEDGLKKDVKKEQAAIQQQTQKFAAEDKKAEEDLSKVEADEKTLQENFRDRQKKLQASSADAKKRTQIDNKKLGLIASHQQVMMGQEQQLQKDLMALRQREVAAKKAQAKQDSELKGLHAQVASAASDSKAHEVAAAKAKAAANAEEKQVQDLEKQATTLQAQLQQSAGALAQSSQRQRAASMKAAEYEQKSAKVAKERDQLAAQLREKQSKALAWQKKVAEERAEIQKDAQTLVQAQRADAKHRVLLKQLYAFSRQQQGRMKTIAAALTPAEKRALKAKAH